MSFRITEDKNFQNFGKSDSVQIGSVSFSDTEIDYIETDNKARIIEYCPRIFRELRYRDGITEDIIKA